MGSFSQDRTGGLEAFITAPLVVTAFIAALFGGFVSPIISNGLRTMSQFEITLPQIRRINATVVDNSTESQSRMLHYLHLLSESDAGFKCTQTTTSHIHLIPQSTVY